MTVSSEAELALAFPPGFLFGAATSAHQVEGHNHRNDWWAWERQDPGRLRDRTPSGAACGWWAGHAEHDIALAAELGHSAHRSSLEWSRIEPEPGRVSSDAIDRYRAMLGAMRDRGLRTMLTLSHFTLPAWARTGWLGPELPRAFERFARIAVDALGDLVDYWVTLNEPIVLAGKAYASRDWPPGTGDPRAGAVALRRQMEAHALAYRQAKEAAPDTPTGIVLNLPRFAPARPRLMADRWSAALQGWVVGGALLRALRTGRCRPPVGLRPRPIDGLAGALDFLGVNYYGRYLIRFDPRHRQRLGGRAVQPDSRKTETADWGQPWPEGLTDELVGAAAIVEVPMHVTENGVYDPDDALRPRFLVEHVAAVHEAIRRGVAVHSYLHWSLVDNFEWAQGWSTPFGLVAVDPRTQERTVKPSARLYATIARAGGLTREVAGRYGIAASTTPGMPRVAGSDGAGHDAEGLR